MQLTEEQIAEIRRLFGEGVIIIVPPRGPTPTKYHDSDPEDGSSDLTIRQYIDRYDPNMSEQRVADWCREGEFPDSYDADGKLVPGAYKLRNAWRITKEGMQERQRRARSRGLEERSAQRAEEATEETKPAPAVEPATTRSSPKSNGQPKPVEPRPMQDAWMNVRKPS